MCDSRQVWQRRDVDVDSCLGGPVPQNEEQNYDQSRPATSPTAHGVCLVYGWSANQCQHLHHLPFVCHKLRHIDAAGNVMTGTILPVPDHVVQAG